MPKMTLRDLRKEFEFIRKSQYKSIRGAWRVDSKKKGPVLGITICTHGNEISGLAALRYLRLNLQIEKKLHRGSIIFTLNNMKACQKFFQAKTFEERRKSRLIDINFNRLPADTLRRKNDHRYEIKRAQELAPIWREFNIAMDIHSTGQDSEPMIICGEKLNTNLFKGFPMNVIISNIDKVQIGKPAFAFYGRPSKPIPMLEIECGSHVNPKSFQRAIIATIALLHNANMLLGASEVHSKKYNKYSIASTVMFPNKSYKLVRIFKNYEFVRRGTLFAVSGNYRIYAPFDCHIFMAPPKTTPKNIEEEVLFLSKPKQVIRLF